MPGTTLEQVTHLADELPVEDQLSLVKHLANRLNETQEPIPSRDAFNAKDLYGIWRESVPDDLDIDDAILKEIRNEWTKEWSLVFEE
jgi:hypothetical protein